MVGAVLFILCIFARNAAESPTATAEATQNDHIAELTSASFENGGIAGDQTPWLVVFHSPNCPHCVNFKPTLAAIAAAGSSRGFSVGEVNCKDEQKLCELLHIRALPTLLLFRDGSAYLYKGNRAHEDVVGFAEKGYARAQLHPPKPPTLREAFGEALQLVREELVALFFNGPPAAKAILFAFVLLFLLIIGAVLYICIDSCRPASKQKRY